MECNNWPFYVTSRSLSIARRALAYYFKGRAMFNDNTRYYGGA